MKKIQTYKYFLASVALLLASCQNEEMTDEWENNQEHIVQVNATISGMQTCANSEEKGNAWTNEDKIRVTNVSANAVAGKEKADFVYDGAGFSLSGTNYAVWVDGENSFEAYYPSGGMAKYENFVLNGYQSTLEGLRENDWMTAEAKVKKASDNRLDLEFKHQLAKVVVKIAKYNDQYSASLPTISDPTFTNLSTDDARIAHPYVLDEEDKDKQVVKAYTIADNEGGMHTFMAILPTGKYEGGKCFLKLKINNERHEVLANSLLTSEGLKAGNAYTFNLTVGKDNVTIGSVTVAEWGTGQELSGTANEIADAHADASTHTVTLVSAKTLTEELIKEALGDSHRLAIKGPMAKDDFDKLKSYLAAHYNEENGTPVDLDLSGAKVAEIPSGALSNDSPSYYLGAVTLPANITAIYARAFKGCTKCDITNWEALTSLTKIDDYVFENTAVSEVVFPASLTKLYDDYSGYAQSCFNSCSQLKKVVFKGDIDGLGSKFFGSCNALAEIDLTACTNVPKASGAFNGITSKKDIKVYVATGMKSKFEGSSPWNELAIEEK